MSKELTEQWRNGTLPENWYYIVLESKDLIGIDGCTDGVFWHTDDKIIEVLSSVPTYNQFVELTEKVEALEEKVKWFEESEDTFEKMAEYWKQRYLTLESAYMLCEANK